MKAEPQNTEHANVEVSYLQTEASEVSAERPHRPRRIVPERNFSRGSSHHSFQRQETCDVQTFRRATSS